MSTLILAGSGEFTPAMNIPDTYFISLATNKTVGIIPTAAGKEADWYKWIENGIKHFTSLGIASFGIPVRTREDAFKEETITKVSKAGMIYLSGGDPAYLLSSLQNTPLWNTLSHAFDQGTLLAGSSAGAMIFGNKVITNPAQLFLYHKAANLDSGFSLIPYIIFPHFNKIRIAKSFLLSSKEIQKAWIGIEEDTALCIIDGKNCSIHGKGKVYIHQGKAEHIYQYPNTFTLSSEQDISS